MAVTVKQLLNRVLVNLGEDEVADATTELSRTYDKLILNLLNTIKEEVEDAHNWRALRVTNTVAVLAAATSTAVAWANDRSRMVRVQNEHFGGEVPLAFDITDAANPIRLTEIDIAEYIYRNTTDPNSSSTSYPTYFAIDNAAGDDVQLLLWPIPATPRTIQLTMVVPPDRYVYDALTDVVAVPAAPIEMGTTWYAMEERGEELGINMLFSEQRYQNVLNAHISRDLSEQGEAQMTVV
jgi:hypothetical protein